jgi:hypothetical protein
MQFEFSTKEYPILQQPEDRFKPEKVFIGENNLNFFSAFNIEKPNTFSFLEFGNLEHRQNRTFINIRALNSGEQLDAEFQAGVLKLLYTESKRNDYITFLNNYAGWFFKDPRNHKEGEYPVTKAEFETYMKVAAENSAGETVDYANCFKKIGSPQLEYLYRMYWVLDFNPFNDYFIPVAPLIYAYLGFYNKTVLKWLKEKFDVNPLNHKFEVETYKGIRSSIVFGEFRNQCKRDMNGINIPREDLGASVLALLEQGKDSYTLYEVMLPSYVDIHNRLAKIQYPLVPDIDKPTAAHLCAESFKMGKMFDMFRAPVTKAQFGNISEDAVKQMMALSKSSAAYIDYLSRTPLEYLLREFQGVREDWTGKKWEPKYTYGSNYLATPMNYSMTLLIAAGFVPVNCFMKVPCLTRNSYSIYQTIQLYGYDIKSVDAKLSDKDPGGFVLPSEKLRSITTIQRQIPVTSNNLGLVRGHKEEQVYLPWMFQKDAVPPLKDKQLKEQTREKATTQQIYYNVNDPTIIARTTKNQPPTETRKRRNERGEEVTEVITIDSIPLYNCLIRTPLLVANALMKLSSLEANLDLVKTMTWVPYCEFGMDAHGPYYTIPFPMI